MMEEVKPEQDYINKLNEYDRVANALPKNYDRLIYEIDHFLFGAQMLFEIGTELVIIANELVKTALKGYEFELSQQINKLKHENTSVSILKDMAKAACQKEKNELYDMENLQSKARLLREMAHEKLQTYKKIKHDNINERNS
jgi:hypothetical protein